ncbi:hypothetical protein BV898_07297 [Hypsibius exemplaris]|uniref:Uncharacterized protein n=1 Tax=Hypsibius exemplaris TaxID=2072580 RepID=A0A1W0WU41_HYPEX|nr:hypothetical protein BV898_07297 [Hypsibius exemplaris]
MSGHGAFFNTPLTDLTGQILTQQGDNNTNNLLCRALELQLFKCMEAAGVPNYRRACKDEFDDFMECRTLKKQQERSVTIQNERIRQFNEGTLKEKYLHNPELHSYGAPGWQ